MGVRISIRKFYMYMYMNLIINGYQNIFDWLLLQNMVINSYLNGSPS